MTPSSSSLAHDPVMLNEMLAALVPRPHETYIDGTFGAGGYTRAILAAAPTCKVIAFDRDPEARARYDTLPDTIRSRITFVDASFSTIESAITRLIGQTVDGVVLDLGVSSPQLDQPERGFSFRLTGPLDMRMDPRGGESAADVVNNYGEKELADILYQYGEERQSRGIARAIVVARKEKPFRTTDDLATLVRRVVRKSPKDKSDPCTRTFQALRIFVNREFDELRAALWGALRVLNEGGRLVVVTFHSLEDRIVKQFFQEQAGRGGHPSRHAPALNNSPVSLHLPHVKPLAPSEHEVARNPRARSAHLRVAIRTATSIGLGGGS